MLRATEEFSVKQLLLSSAISEKQWANIKYPPVGGGLTPLARCICATVRAVEPAPTERRQTWRGKKFHDLGCLLKIMKFRFNASERAATARHHTIRLKLCVLNRDRFGNIDESSAGNAPSQLASVAA